MPTASSRAALAAALIALFAIGSAHSEVRTVELRPGGPAPAPLGPDIRWALGQDSTGASLLEAPGHPLSPRIPLGEAGAAAVSVPGLGWVRMTPLAVGPADPAAAGLAAGRRTVELAPDGTGQVARISDAWAGIDELWGLRPDSVKHDLVVHESVGALLAGRDLRATWEVSVPAGARLALEERGGAVLRDADGRFLARIPRPVVAESGDAHYHAGLARLALSGGEGGVYRLDVTVSGAWLAQPAREYPVLVDPTVSLQPADDLKTGFVDELGDRLDDEMVSGTLLLVGYGSACRAFAEFPLGTIPDSATILDSRLHVWLSNHDNPTDPALPLTQEVKFCPLPASASNAALHAAIPPQGSGRIYVADSISRTGPEWCPDAYVFRDYNLGPLGDADVQSQLPLDYFTVGLTSSIGADLEFDHIDQIGYSEVVNNPFVCTTTTLPGSRITLLVTYETNNPPTCNAGGPYVSDCPSTPIPLDGTRSSDPDGDPITFAWTSDCSGTIGGADTATPTLFLDPSCAESCTVTLTVSDGALSSTCSAPVSAADLTPPVISGSLIDGLCLWPPRHDFYCLGDPSGYVTATDSCQANVLLRWTGCESDQPDEAREAGRPENGDGHFPDDCQVSEDGRTICVRVERAGNDPEGRYYSVGVIADDGCGNTAVVRGRVHVPHDRSGGSGGQDDPCQRGNKEK